LLKKKKTREKMKNKSF